MTSSFFSYLQFFVGGEGQILPQTLSSIEVFR